MIAHESLDIVVTMDTQRFLMLAPNNPVFPVTYVVTGSPYNASVCTTAVALASLWPERMTEG